MKGCGRDAWGEGHFAPDRLSGFGPEKVDFRLAYRYGY
jgi:hypothetical protein